MATPWVSFCISTYKRPAILKEQLALLSQQTFRDFEIVVSDNDPDASAHSVVEGFGDPRFRYFHNENNLGMIRSFNKSIERSSGEFVVMVTDDDPVQPDFLATFHELAQQHPGYSIYCGFQRKQKKDGEVEVISNKEFMPQILDPDKTSNLLWSSAVARKEAVMQIGLIPDFGSPHLADHAFMALVGSVNGGVIMNKMYSSLSSHDTNFSKTNLQYYVSGCEGFYRFMHGFAEKQDNYPHFEKAISKHLGHWVVAVISNLKRYYTFVNKDEARLQEVEKCAHDILAFPFMKKHKPAYYFKEARFQLVKLKRRLKL